MQPLKQLDKRLKKLEKELPAQAKRKLQQAVAYRAKIERLMKLRPYEVESVRKQYGLVDPRADAIDRYFLGKRKEYEERQRILLQNRPHATAGVAGSPETGRASSQPAKPETLKPIAAPVDTSFEAPMRSQDGPKLRQLSPGLQADLLRVKKLLEEQERILRQSKKDSKPGQLCRGPQAIMDQIRKAREERQRILLQNGPHATPGVAGSPETGNASSQPAKPETLKPIATQADTVGTMSLSSREIQKALPLHPELREVLERMSDSELEAVLKKGVYAR